MKRQSRIKRWNEAVAKAELAQSDLQEALQDLADIKEEYQDWRDGLPDNLEMSATAEKLDAVCDIDFDAGMAEIDEAIQEALNADLPLGFGRD